MSVKTVNTWRCDRNTCAILEQTTAPAFYPKGWQTIPGGHWLCKDCYAEYEELIRQFFA